LKSLHPNPSTVDLILELRAIKEEFDELFGISIVGIIGSRARGDHTPSSDIDIAVRRQRKIGLLTVARARAWLEQHFGSSVDLVFFESLPDYKRSVFLQDLREVA
jgi:predicted nucleotidyltransferase